MSKSNSEELSTTSANIQDVGTVQNLNGLKSYILKSSELLIRQVKDQGDHLYTQVKDLESLKDNESLRPSIVESFVKGQEAKQLALLYRDILFESIKAELLGQEESRSAQTIDNFLVAAKDTIKGAEEDYRQRTSIERLNNADAKSLLKQDNPWPVYQGQLEAIEEQITLLTDSQKDLSTLSKSVRALNKEIVMATDKLKNAFEEIVANVSTLYRDPNTDHKTGLMLLNEISDKLDRPILVNKLHKKIEQVISTAPAKMTPIVGLHHGELVQQDIAPQYQMEQWYEVAILPRIEEANQKIDTVTYNFKLALINVINRLELLQTNTQPEFHLSDHITPIDTLLTSVDDHRSGLKEIMDEIDEIISEALSLESLLVKDLGFLTIGFQGSINRFRREQNIVLERLGYYWRLAKDKYFTIKSTVNEESSLGKIEKVIRYLQSSSIDRNNVHYNNFFNAKVTLVEAFWISRELEEKRIAQVIDAWNKGYNAAVLLHGDYFSGKTSMGEWISQHYFRNKTYGLQPNKDIVVAGQKIEVGNDLIAALNTFIEKVQYAKPLILIDDLELWFDHDRMADAIMEDLVQLINRYAKKVCFVVSMGSWTYEKLRIKAAIDESFQAIIKLSPFKKEQIKDAILLRHGASHKSILNQDDGTLTKGEFDRKIGQIHHASKGNIGHALKLWLSAVRLKDDDHVRVNDLVKYRFPDIMDRDNDILLYTLMSYRRLNAKSLASIIGPSFETKYKHALERLIGYGVVKRSFNGILSVNDKVVPEITNLLHKHKYI